MQRDGKVALSGAERQELRALMEGIEQILHKPLDDGAKASLRAEARRSYKRIHPELAEFLDTLGGKLPIHHRCPLEYAHLFPEKDINAVGNLAMVTRDVHERINALWIKFRKARPQASALDVEAAARTIDEQFASWYHQVSASSREPNSLRQAEEAALKQLRRLFPELE